MVFDFQIKSCICLICLFQHSCPWHWSLTERLLSILSLAVRSLEKCPLCCSDSPVTQKNFGFVWPDAYPIWRGISLIRNVQNCEYQLVWEKITKLLVAWRCRWLCSAVSYVRRETCLQPGSSPCLPPNSTAPGTHRGHEGHWAEASSVSW